MVEFLIDNIYEKFGGHAYQKTLGIPLGTKCTPLVADLSLYSYEADFVQHLQKKVSLWNNKHNWIILISIIILMLYTCIQKNLFEICIFSVQGIYSGFKSYWSRGILQGNVRLLLGYSMGVIIRHLVIAHFDTSVSHNYVEGFVHQLCHITGFQLICLNHDECHMWGRKCPLFLEHLISLPMRSSWFHPFIIYTVQNLSVLELCVMD